MECYQHCLTDIDLAVKYNYPENKRKKLLDRKAYCLNQLDEQSNENELIDKKQDLINFTNSVDNEWKEKIFANEDLKAGQIVIEEKAFGRTLNKLKYYERCFNCLRNADRYVFPCRNCAQIKFCSERCSDDAWSSGHFLECNKIPLLDTFKANYPFENIQIALKSLLKIDLNNVFKKIRKPNPKDEKNFSENDRMFLNILTELKSTTEFKEEDYESVAQIVTYLVDEHEIPKKLLKSVNNSADIELFGAILTRYLNQLQSNALTITNRDLKILELRNCPHAEIYHPFEEIEIGRGIFPIYNRFEHDLDPNCQILKFSNDKLIVSALKEIKKGDLLTVNRCLDSFIDHNLKLEDYKANKNKYAKFVYQYGFKCICCSEGPMLILNENGLIYVDCLKCGFNKEFKQPKNEKEEEEEEDQQMKKVNEHIANKNFCVKQAKKSKMLLYTKQPDLKIVEHNLLESMRELKEVFFFTNLFFAEIEFDLAICLLQLRMYVRSIKHAMKAIDIWRSHFTIHQMQYLNGLIRLINVQYYFINYTNTTNRELDVEHRTLYNYNLNNLKENLEFIINKSEIFFGDKNVKEKLFTKLNDKLNSINKFESL